MTTSSRGLPWWQDEDPSWYEAYGCYLYDDGDIPTPYRGHRVNSHTLSEDERILDQSYTATITAADVDLIDLPRGYHDANIFRLKYGRYPTVEEIELTPRGVPLTRDEALRVYGTKQRLARLGPRRREYGPRRCGLCGKAGHNRRTCDRNPDD